MTEAKPVSDFRDDGRAAVDWVARYLEGVRELPVLAQVEPGEIRGAAPGLAARGRPSRSRPSSRDLDEILLPGITHWNHPRFFAYFSISGSEPGILAELLIAALNVNGMLWRTSPAATELEELAADWVRQLIGLSRRAGTATSRTPRRPRRSPRSPPRASSGPAARSSAPSTPTPRSTRRRGSSGLPLRKVEADEEFRLRPDALRGRRRTRARPPSWPPSARPRRRPSIRCRRSADIAEAAGAWLHVDAAYAGSAMVCEELRWAFEGVERADSLVVNPHKWLFTPVDCSLLYTRRPEELRARLQPRARLPADATRRRRTSWTTGRARPALPRAQALGRDPLLRTRGARGDDPGALAAGAALRRLGRGRAGLGDRGAGSVLGRLLPARGLRRGEPRRSSSGPTRPASSSSRRPSSTGGSSSAWRSGTCGRPRTTSAGRGRFSSEPREHLPHELVRQSRGHTPP